MYDPREDPLRACALVALLLLPALGCRGRELPPDLLLITLDTTRIDGLGCYGGAGAHTPRLDALARTGVRFAQAITPAPYTGPSHASLLSGLDPPRHGLRDFLNQAMDPHVTTLAELLRARGYHTGAFLSSYVLDRRFGLERGFELYSCDFWRTFTHGAAPRIVQGSAEFERRGAATVDEALDWMGRGDGEGAPTFVWVHLFDPHMPYDPPAPYAPPPPEVTAGAEEEAAQARRRYYGEIAYADGQVGRLLDWLERTGRLDHTIVAVAADHGELLGDHGRAMGTHSTHLVEATLRVPLIVRAPGMAPGVVREQVRLVDVMPTLLQIVGIAPPPGLDGRSLLPAMRGQALTLPPAYSETFYEQFPEVAAPGQELVSLRDGRFKLVRSPLRRELYDLASDPDELRDVAAEHPDVVATLEAALGGLHAPGAAPLPLGLSEEERQRHLERLRALGYVR